MARLSKENELLGKAVNFKTYRLKCEKVLEWRQKQVNELLSSNMSLEDSAKMQDIETQARLKLEDIDSEFAKSCYPDY